MFTCVYLQEKAVIDVKGKVENVVDNCCILNSTDHKGLLDWFGDVSYQKAIAKDDGVEVSTASFCGTLFKWQ